MYRAAGLVGRTGVRVDRRGVANVGGSASEGSGEVLGVGRLTLHELGERFPVTKSLGSPS